MTDNAPNTEVAQQSAEYRYALEDWLLIDALRGGTRAMRLMGTTYLPQRPLESADDYRSRLAVATLFPAFIETIKSLVGRVFAEPLILNEDIPKWIKDEVLGDVDLQGRNFHVFAREWFKEALEYGMSHVIVDSPTDTGETMAEQKAEKVRPYLVRIHPRNVIGWKEDENGELTQLRVTSNRVDQDGEFSSYLVDQIRVYERTGVRVFEKIKSTGEWQQVDEIPSSLGRIPIITLYTNRVGFLMAEPPLRELAYLNAKHWRMQSGMETLIETASVPILAITGVDGGDDLLIGAKHAIKLPSGAEVKYVEHSGKAIEAGQAALDATVEEMRQAGAAILRPQTHIAKTATQINDEAARDNSTLASMVRTFEDTCAALLDLVAAWRGGDKGGTVKAQPNLNPDDDPNALVTSMVALGNGGIVSRQTIFETVKQGGLIREDLTWEQEQERIAAQGL